MNVAKDVSSQVLSSGVVRSVLLYGLHAIAFAGQICCKERGSSDLTNDLTSVSRLSCNVAGIVFEAGMSAMSSGKALKKSGVIVHDLSLEMQSLKSALTLSFPLAGFRL